MLVATILAPLILAVSKGADWGWASPEMLVCLLVSIVSVFGFVVVEKRSPAPLVDLALMRNKVLIGATLGILIGAGTINGLMFVVSLYFQDPSTFGMSPVGGRLGNVAGDHRPRRARRRWFRRWRERSAAATVVRIGFAAHRDRLRVLAFIDASWGYAVFVIPFLVAAVGMSMTNGPCSSVSTSAVPAEQVGAASGISNMARYVGAAVFTAVAAAVYGGTTTSKIADGHAPEDTLASGSRGWRS